MMRTQLTRIRRNNDNQQSRISLSKQAKISEEHSSSTGNQMSKLINLLQVFVTQKSQPLYDLQPRDKHPIIEWSNSRINNKELQIWITNVCRTTFSTAFNYYNTDQLSYQQARMFCSETLIKNILKLTEVVKLNLNQIKKIDEYIQNKILPYMVKKYPLTGETDINKALEQAVEEVNSFNQLQNDIIYLTKIKFSYRKSGNYNDLIMNVLNKVLRIVDQTPINHNQTDLYSPSSNYKDFERVMSAIFQKVEDFNWMNKKNTEKQEIVMNVDQKQNEKYREDVKAYTSYLIGRKVSENVDLFSENEISNEHLVIKNSSILRILTKWCEQLEGKFTNANYMKEHLENIETLSGDINSLNDQHRQILDEKLNAEKLNIQQYLRQLRQSFYSEQSSELLTHLQPDDNNFIQPYEKAFGKFSCQMVKNLHTYILKYLNRLIHGLVKVSYSWHRESGYKDNYEKWSYPPNLVTFKIGDLIRCKCSSKEKEILSIFNQLSRISTKNPEKLKIIRIKNRLRTQTNDILINIKFNNCLIGEVQLAVNTKKSKFALCSNNFSHYLYQLQRCIFGPISQLANIWKNTDIRSKQFDNIIALQGRSQIGIQELRKAQGENSCTDSPTGHDYISYDLPFRCTYCRSYHSHNDILISNLQCQQCKVFQCMRCQIILMNPEEIKIKILGKKYEEMRRNVELASNELPSYGCFLEIDSRTPKLTIFKQYKINGILYYLGKRDNKVYRVVKNDQKSIKNFFYHNIVFKLKDEEAAFGILTNTEVKESFILPQYLQKLYKSEKQALFLNQKKISQNKWPTILSSFKYPESLLNIKKIEIANNDLKNLDFIPKTFPNLEQIYAQKNQGCSLEPLTTLPKLRHINFQRNGITEVPKQINQLNKLQQFNIYKNNVSSLPKEIFQIKTLKVLNIKYNLFIQLPEELGNLQNLNQLLLRGNKLKQIPDCIEKLTKLNILNAGKCGLNFVNPKIGTLKELKILDLASNQLPSIPDSFKELTKLEKFKIQENKITKIPEFVSNYTNLVQFMLYSNQIQQFSLDFTKLSKLVTLNFSYNLIANFDRSIAKLPMLTEIHLHGNKLTNFSILSDLTSVEDISLDVPTKEASYSCLPKEVCMLNTLLILKLKTTQNKLLLTPAIRNLNQLQQLHLGGNGLIEVPREIVLLTSLQKLSFEDNKIDRFPIEYLKNLSKLEEVNFKGNQFKKIQKQLFQHLKVIDLSNNLISEVQIPNSSNTTLKKLSLRQNLLTKVPKHLQYLKKLTEIDLSSNKITILEQDLNQFRNAEQLSFKIQKNPLKSIQCRNFIETQMCEETKIFVKILLEEKSLRMGIS